MSIPQDVEFRTQVKELLWNIHPIECDYVGDAVVDELASGRTHFEDFYGGSRTDQNTIIEIIKASVPVVVAVIQYLSQAKKNRASDTAKGTQLLQKETVIVLIQNATSLNPEAKAQLFAIVNDSLQSARSQKP